MNMRALTTKASCVTCLLLTLFFSAIFFAHAATEEFTIDTVVTGDVVAPSAPGTPSTTPISYDQIDLVWATSTDNVKVIGYHIWRDNLTIATTTGNTYSDVGLTASTTYSYYITAFDGAFNESASSTEVSTTTPGIPPPPPEATSTPIVEGTLIIPFKDMLDGLTINPGQYSAEISFRTNSVFRAVLKWGKTPSYELGSLAERAYNRTHNTIIEGLTPGTTYYFTIEGDARGRRHGAIYHGTFVTQPPDDIFPPSNVLNLKAVRTGNDIFLSWDNPPEDDFSKVRVVRSSLFYPSDVADGWVVYEGSEEGVYDIGPGDGPLYYSVFSYDQLGNISSGAVVFVQPIVGTISDQKDDSTGSSDDTVDYEEMTITFDDLVFSQEGKVITPQDGELRFDGSKQLYVEAPYSLFPRELKTILLTVRDTDSSENLYTFLMRINKNTEMYETVLPAVGEENTFVLNLTVYNRNAVAIGHAEGKLISEIFETTDSTEDAITFLRFMFERGWFLIILFLIASYLLIVILKRDKTEDDVPPTPSFP